MGVMFRNSWTTVLGFLAGFINYMATSGATMPTTKQDWLNLLLSAVLAGAGIVAKDARTGSQPK